jgi:hypothetical protein
VRKKRNARDSSWPSSDCAAKNQEGAARPATTKIEKNEERGDREALTKTKVETMIRSFPPFAFKLPKTVLLITTTRPIVFLLVIRLLQRFTTIPPSVWHAISFTERLWSWQFLLTEVLPLLRMVNGVWSLACHRTSVESRPRLYGAPQGGPACLSPAACWRTRRNGLVTIAANGLCGGGDGGTATRLPLASLSGSDRD